MRAEAVALVDAGMNYSAAGRELGVSWMSVRTWARRAGVSSPESRPGFALGPEGPLERFESDWERARAEDHGGYRPTGSRKRSPLFVGFTAERGRCELPRPDLPVGAVIDPEALDSAMAAWRSRAATATAEDVLGRHMKSTWEASTR